MNNRVHTTVR